MYYSTLMAVADAERYQRITHSDSLRVAIGDLCEILPEGFVEKLPYVTNDFQVKHKASILQRETYKALTAYLPKEDEETIYNIITGATVYTETNDPDSRTYRRTFQRCV